MFWYIVQVFLVSFEIDIVFVVMMFGVQLFVQCFFDGGFDVFKLVEVDCGGDLCYVFVVYGLVVLCGLGVYDDDWVFVYDVVCFGLMFVLIVCLVVVVEVEGM